MKKIWLFIKKQIRRILLLLFLVVAGIAFIQVAGPLFLVMFEVNPIMGYTLVAVLIAVFLIRYTVLLCKRARFLRDLKKECRAYGFAMHKRGKPLLSAWFLLRGSVEIEAKDKIYTLFFIPCRNRRMPITLSEDGTVIFHHAIRLSIRRVIRATLFAWDHHWRFAESIPPHSYVLLAPAPRAVSAVVDGARVIVDNGTTVGHYAVYTCGAFLRSFSRMVDG